MNTSVSLRRAIRLAIGGAALAAAFPGTTALAQDAEEEIVVIGSRIPRSSDFQSPSPVLSVDRDSIEKSGYGNLQQLMERVPANGNGAFSTRGNNQDSTANGAASISLRGFGADATLVLVNGRRVAVSPFAESITTNFVDINSIPVSAIERVEVLKDGASAVYGSDAVAGVINIVLRNNFEGIELSGGYGDTTESDYQETTASAMWGLGGDAGNVTFILDYWKNTSLFNAERGRIGFANQEPFGGPDLRSSRSFPGTFVVDGTITSVDPACPPERNVGVCLFDYGPFNVLIPEAERTGLMVLGHTDLGAGIQFFTEIAAQHNNSIAQGAPTPLDEGAGLTVPTTHPDNPFPGATTIDILRYRTVDAGARQWDISTDNLRGVFGFRGEFGNWNWEVAAQRARSESEQTGDRTQGWVRTDFLQQQIDAGLYNPFGATQNDPAVIQSITTNLVRRGKADLKMMDAQVSGEIFQLGGRPVLMAAGVEYREESVSDIPDDQFQRGLIFGTESVSAKADRENTAAFVEFAVPVLEGLDLELAARFDDYDDFGSTTNPKIAVRYAPIDMLALRASWGTGFRAPSLAQIGLGPSQESQFFIDQFACDGGLAIACNALDYTIVFSGNPNLQPEESETFNVGVAFKPTEQMEFTIDYWDISQEDKIDEAPFGFIYQQFCGDQNSTVCVRAAPIGTNTLGPLQQINSGFVNIGEQAATGIDFGGYFSADIANNTLTVAFNYSRLLNFEKVELNSDGDAFVTRELTGEYEYPEDRAVLSADFGNDTWGVYGNINYIGPFEDQPDIDLDGTLDFDQFTTPEVSDFTTINLQFRYTGIENMRFLLGIDNVLDEEVPNAFGDGDTDVYGYVQSQHTPRGRFWNAKAIFTF
jgi:iron complex outermembrane receptor protein